MTTPFGDLVFTLAQGGPEKSLLDYVLQGREIGLIIVALSLVVVGLIVAQFVQTRRSRLAPPETVDSLSALLDANDTDGAIRYCREHEPRSFLTRVFGAALVRCSRSPFGFLELKSALEEAGQTELARLYRLTDGIQLIATISPMLGLLGTVVGMVGAFDTISMTEGPARPDQLAGSIQAALVTTVLGLIVAIPSTAAYTFLRNRIDALVADVAEQIEELASLVETSGTRDDSGAKAGGAA